MDSFSVSFSRPPVWQCQWWKQPEQSLEKNCFNAKTPFFCSKQRLAKPVPFLRLGSTGESVEDLPVFENFNPSNFQRTSTAAGKPKPKAAGVFDRFAKPLGSSNISGVLGQLAAKNLTSATSAVSFKRSRTDVTNLSFLVEKFDKSSPQTNMEMQGSLHDDNLPYTASASHQGGMNGFVKEGVYHSYTRNLGRSTQTFAPSTSNLPVNGRPVFQAFRFLKIDPVHQNRFQHHHPYMNRNGWEKPAMSSMQYHWQPGTSRVPMHSVNWWMRAHRGSSQALHNQFVDPRIRTQFISTEALANRLQSQSPHMNHQSKNPKVVKNETDVKRGNECAGLLCTGSPNQAQSTPPTSMTSKNTPKQKKPGSEPDLGVFVQLNQNEEAMQLSDCEVHVKEVENKSIPVHVMPKSMPGEVKNLFQEVVQDGDKSGVENGKIVPQQGVDSSPTCSRTYGMGIPPPGNETSLEFEETFAITTSLSNDLHVDDHLSNNIGSITVQSTSSDELSDIGPEMHCTSNILHQASHFDDALAEQSEACAGSNDPELSKLDSKLHVPSPSTRLHSSLAYILSQSPNSDSDFSDSDWGSSASTSPTSYSWDFLNCWDDPYNPLYGWKCANRLMQTHDQEQVSQTVQLDRSLDDERDSGISFLQAQRDSSEDHTDSSSWDEDSDKEKSPNSSHLWNALCSSSDPFNPINGWMCKTPKMSEIESPTATKNTKNDKGCELKIQNKFAHWSSCSNSDEVSAETCESSKSEKIPGLHNTKCNPSKMHPSVMFVLGMADSDSSMDSDSDSDWDSDWDSEESDSDFDSFTDSEWNSDPYNPLLHWRLHPVTPDKLKAVNAAYKCASLDKETTTEQSLHSSGRSTSTLPGHTADSVTMAPASRPLLKSTCTSNTGCLWVPDNGRGRGTGGPMHNKKVRFCERSPTVISFEAPMWSSEYTECRKGPWQEMARDRCRFMDRIRSTEAQIAHVFAPSHRAIVRGRLHIQA